MNELRFMVTVTHPDWVSVRWLQPLDRAGRGLYHLLRETLEELHGVEQVYLNRYSASIEIAPHVVDANDVAQEIVAALADPEGEFHNAVRFQFHNPTLIVESTVGEESPED